MAREFSKPFYNSHEWAEVRSFCLMRDKYICQKCKVKPAEEVHHIIRLSPDNIGDINITMNPNNLISLCKDCHFEEHKEEKKKAIARANTKRKSNNCFIEYEFDENGYIVEIKKEQ